MKKLNILHLALLANRKRANKMPIYCLMSLSAIVLLAHGQAWATGVNDTGITAYGNNSSSALTSEPADFPGQDASYGRDAEARAGTLTKVGGGNAGFDFTKIDANGNTLPATAATWSCVRDNVTGLVWEMKTDDGGLHDKDWTYTWYNSTGVNDGGSAGTAAGGSCGGTVAAGCDTEKFVAAVNASGLCGATDWRLPSRNELLNIVDNSRLNPAIDINYFPNTSYSNFWSSSPCAANDPLYHCAWSVDFGIGRVSGSYTVYDYSSYGIHEVRLVRGGQ